MASLKETSNGAPYFEITADELIEYSDNPKPICGECLCDISNENEIALIPILIEKRRTEFYKNYFGI